MIGKGGNVDMRTTYRGVGMEGARVCSWGVASRRDGFSLTELWAAESSSVEWLT